MALKCYPLQPGGLLAFEAIAIGMTNAEHVKAEIVANFEVVLLFNLHGGRYLFYEATFALCFHQIISAYSF